VSDLLFPSIWTPRPKEFVHGPYIIRGLVASRPEYMAHLVLERRKAKYWYQVPLMSYWGLRGSVKVDYLIQVGAILWPLEVQSYWHEGEKGADDKLREILIAQRLGVPKVKELWEYQTDTIETTEAALQALQLI